MISLDSHPAYEETKSDGKKPLLLTKPSEKEPKYLDIVVKLVKKLSNEVVDLMKNNGEGSSKPRPFYPFFKRNDSASKPPKVPCPTLNLYDFGMDNFYSYHHHNHYEKTCPQWVNSMSLVINQLLDQQEINGDQIKEVENEETIEEATRESAMFLWHWCIDSDEEQID